MGHRLYGNRRSSPVELTAEGRRVLADAGRAFDEELQRWLGDAVPERTLRQFAATLGRLRSAGKQTGLEKTA
jgi:MarR family transcriptional regulator, organic hydroperoxide resistance regulator